MTQEEKPQLRRRIVVRGDVQGVGYRFSAQRAAGRHGVAGWIRNCPDGSVEAVLEGERAAVEAMIEWCRHGPPHAEVRELEAHEEVPEGLAGFSSW
jgi:acylphosphatase